MKTFSCSCGNTLYFQNVQCVNCQSELGYLPNELKLSDIHPLSDGVYQATGTEGKYKKCINYSKYNICNWMVEESDTNDLCVSCRLTNNIPNLSVDGNLQLWFKMEDAKRRLLDSLMKLELPFKKMSPNGLYQLGFAFLENQVEDEFGNELTMKQYVSTGHSNGLITINLDEADPSKRVEMREQMDERYRTLLGHFRHESGHFYWDLLVKNSDFLQEFRDIFGDERLSYQHALQNYYQNGPAPNWQEVWVSAYASMHPWEDWAETWAHYLHMVDTLETANNFDFGIGNKKLTNPLQKQEHRCNELVESLFNEMFDDWLQLSTTLNALNRSMGLDDAYPFVISTSALNKLKFVHRVIEENAE